MTYHDAIILGGGLAGSAIATWLAQKQADVLVLERALAPQDKVCGEFLSRETRLYLKLLGIDLTALGAVPVSNVTLVHKERVIEEKLPFEASSLSRKTLDAALLVRAEAAGATVQRGARVRKLVKDGTGWRVELDDERVIFSQSVFLATGKHDLPGWKRPSGIQGDLVGFKLPWRLTDEATRRLSNQVFLVLFKGGYGGIEPIEQGAANLCILIRKSRLAELGNQWQMVLAAIRAEVPTFDHLIQGGRPLLDRPLAIASIPYGYVCWRSDGPWRLGDQAAVIPSFAGDGMAIALHSAHLAAKLWLQNKDSGTYQRQLSRDVAGGVYLASALSLALVRSGGQEGLMRLAGYWPWLIPKLALQTRVPDRALKRMGIIED